MTEALFEIDQKQPRRIGGFAFRRNTFPEQNVIVDFGQEVRVEAETGLLNVEPVRTYEVGKVAELKGDHFVPQAHSGTDRLTNTLK